jgi:hypothetical protein
MLMTEVERDYWIEYLCTHKLSLYYSNASVWWHLQENLLCVRVTGCLYDDDDVDGLRLRLWTATTILRVIYERSNTELHRVF